ncbi:MAG: hypothetical protein ACP5RD_09025, partial [bacterium]
LIAKLHQLLVLIPSRLKDELNEKLRKIKFKIIENYEIIEVTDIKLLIEISLYANDKMKLFSYDYKYHSNYKLLSYEFVGEKIKLTKQTFINYKLNEQQLQDIIKEFIKNEVQSELTNFVKQLEPIIGKFGKINNFKSNDVIELLDIAIDANKNLIDEISGEIITDDKF